MKELDKIIRKTNITSKNRKSIEDRLTEIALDLHYKRKHVNSAFFDDYYYQGLKNFEYMFGDLDDYYKPILAGGNSEGTYQFYTCRGDKDKDTSIDTYLSKVTPFLPILIDEKKITDQKIQLDIGKNLRHITEDKIMTFFTKSANIKCLQSDMTDDILQQLITSLYKSYQEDITTCRTDSSLVYESVEGLGIHFHTLDLNRGCILYTLSWLVKK